jgi:uncharacterized membrane protein
MAYDLLEYISLFGVVIVIGLVSALLYIYIQNYRQIKVTYGLGLILFATIIIIHNIIKIVEWVDYEDHVIDMIRLFEIIFEIIAFSILLKISWDH